MNINYQKFKNSKIYTTISIFIFAFIILLLLWNSPFSSDDWTLISFAKENPLSYKIGWASEGASYYRPITMLSFYFNFSLSKYNPLIYYISNILIHIINSIIVIHLLLILNNSFRFGVSNKIIYLSSILFFLLPQNLHNVIWISGRADLLCLLFVLLSFLYSIKFIYNSNHKYKYLVLFGLNYILALGCKEVAVIINFYLILLFYITKQKKADIFIKLKLLSILSISISIIYLICRIIMWDDIINLSLIPKNIFYIVSMYFYGVISFIFPIDIIELYSLIFNNIILFLFVLFVVIILIVNLFRIILKNKSKRKLELFTYLLFFSFSVFIYITIYPTSRLAYNHILLFLIPFIFLLNSSYLTDIKSYKIITYSITILMFIGIYFILVQKQKIDNYNNILYETLNTSIVQNKNVISVASLMTVGQMWSLPVFDKIFYNDESEKNKKNITSLYGVKTCSQDNLFNSIEYFRLNDSSFIVNVLNNTTVLSPTGFPYNYLNIYTLNISNDIKISIIKNSNFRSKYASSILVSVKKEIINNYAILHIKNGKILLDKFSNFIANLKSISDDTIEKLY